MDISKERIVGMFQGVKKGPLLIIFGGMHGNEPAGVMALQRMFDMLKSEPAQNPTFQFSGKLMGLKGNLKALQQHKRFLVKDLNRQWTVENIARVKTAPTESLDAEDKELMELILIIEKEIATYEPEHLVILDLHTTTATGGIFTVVTDDPESSRIGLELHAPVIKGLLAGISGSTLHYFTKQNTGIKTTSLCFESGQHIEALSVDRAVAAITNCLRSIGCVRAEDVENRHDQLLLTYSKYLPKITELITVHQIKPEDQFLMQPGYLNFKPVKKGEVLAKDKNGNIHAQTDGLILMPLYQPQGNDGFFLVKKIEF